METRLDGGVHRAARPALARASEDLAEAFETDPLFDWFMKPGRGRAPARRRFFRVVLNEVALPDGEVEIPEGGGGAAGWIPAEALGDQPITRELRALPMLLNASGLGRFGRLLRLRNVMDAGHPMDRPHDYLWFLGVHPDRQGSGLGSKLLAARTERLDGQGRCGFLETGTPRNLPLYQRHGFEILQTYQPPPDGPTIWTMWREPKG